MFPIPAEKTRHGISFAYNKSNNWKVVRKKSLKTNLNALVSELQFFPDTSYHSSERVSGESFFEHCCMGNLPPFFHVFHLSPRQQWILGSNTPSLQRRSCETVLCHGRSQSSSCFALCIPEKLEDWQQMANLWELWKTLNGWPGLWGANGSNCVVKIRNDL